MCVFRGWGTDYIVGVIRRAYLWIDLLISRDLLMKRKIHEKIWKKNIPDIRYSGPEEAVSLSRFRKSKKASVAAVEGTGKSSERLKRPYHVGIL